MLVDIGAHKHKWTTVMLTVKIWQFGTNPLHCDFSNSFFTCRNSHQCLHSSLANWDLLTRVKNSQKCKLSHLILLDVVSLEWIYKLISCTSKMCDRIYKTGEWSQSKHEWTLARNWTHWGQAVPLWASAGGRKGNKGHLWLSKTGKRVKL